MNSQPSTRPGRTAAAATTAALSIATVIASASVAAQTATPLDTRALAATCAGCHGTDGRAVQGQAMVALAGRPKAEIAAQMQAFRSGTRPATVMHQIAKGYSPAQIEAIASYFETLR